MPGFFIDRIKMSAEQKKAGLARSRIRLSGWMSGEWCGEAGTIIVILAQTAPQKPSNCPYSEVKDKLQESSVRMGWLEHSSATPESCNIYMLRKWRIM